MPMNDVNFLKQYMNPVFVETGTFQGEGVQLALDAGFQSILSVELHPNNYTNCLEKFKNNNNVILFHGHSEDVFWDMIKDINVPITFWLDSHYSGCGDTYVTMKGKTFSSIMSELEAISKHPIKNHTILIDDVRDFGTINFDHVGLKRIVDAVFKINPNYIINYETGYIGNDLFKEDILVARI